jgi:hypothetical protein
VPHKEEDDDDDVQVIAHIVPPPTQQPEKPREQISGVQPLAMTDFMIDMPMHIQTLCPENTSIAVEFVKFECMRDVSVLLDPSQTTNKPVLSTEFVSMPYNGPNVRRRRLVVSLKLVHSETGEEKLLVVPLHPTTQKNFSHMLHERVYGRDFTQGDVLVGSSSTTGFSAVMVCDPPKRGLSPGHYVMMHPNPVPYFSTCHTAPSTNGIGDNFKKLYRHKIVFLRARDSKWNCNGLRCAGFALGDTRFCCGYTCDTGLAYPGLYMQEANRMWLPKRCDKPGCFCLEGCMCGVEHARAGVFVRVDSSYTTQLSQVCTPNTARRKRAPPPVTAPPVPDPVPDTVLVTKKVICVVTADGVKRRLIPLFDELDT